MTSTTSVDPVPEIADAAERARLLARAAGIFSGYPGYQERAGATGRTIPVLALTPTSPR